MTLINHQISHVLVEFYECRFLAKNKGQSYPLIQGAKVPSNHKPPHEHHMDWRAHKPQQTDVPQAQVINREHEGPLTSDPAQDEGSWDQGLVGQPWILSSLATMWSSSIGCLSRLRWIHPILGQKVNGSPYKYKGRGSKRDIPRYIQDSTV